MAKPQTIIYNGKTVVSPWNVDSNVGWTVLGETSGSEAAYFRHVPWLYRAVKDRANNVGAMPFAIMQNETVKDSSDKYTNWLQFLPSPGRTLRLLEMSIAMTGKAYLFLETNKSGYIKSVQYCAPSTIEAVRGNNNEITGYKRRVGSQTVIVPPSNILAIYDPDYCVESGEPKSSAAQAALVSAGVLYNADHFISDYFERGAIKATVLSMDGGGKDEAERLTHWWSDVVGGIKNAWAAIVLRSKSVTPTIIGEGLEGLQNETLTTERRQNIAAALGIPESKMWSSASNYATRVEDEKAYYNGTIIPECWLIAEAFNTQVFTAEHKLAGVRLEFLPETLEIFQEDRAAQAGAAKGFADFLAACPTADIALQTALMVGFEISDELEKAIVEYYAKKEERSEEMAQQLANAPTPPEQGEQEEDEQSGEEEPNQAEVRSALAAWKRKAVRAVERGESAQVEFTSSVIPARVREAIRYELEACKTVEEVKAAFESAYQDRVTPSLIGAIEGQLEQAKTQADIQRILHSAVLWRGYP